MEVDGDMISEQGICRIRNSVGLTFSVYENGSIDRIEQGRTRINLISGSALSINCSNVYLRVYGKEIKARPILGEWRVGDDGVNVQGEFEGIGYTLRLLLAEDEAAWLWDVKLSNNHPTENVKVDLIYVQDVGMSSAGPGEQNSYYVSQYIDYTALRHSEHGDIICCRQNEHGASKVPWLALGSIGRVSSFSTDGMQFFGAGYRQSGIPAGLTAENLAGLTQQELAVVALQEEPVELQAGQSVKRGFFGIFNENHSEPTSVNDLARLEPVIEKLRVQANESTSSNCLGESAAGSIFSDAAMLESEDLDEAELRALFGGERRFEEFAEGKPLSFFRGDNQHVVLRAKELMVERPHGHIYKSGSGLLPDEETLSCTSYMFGVFWSHVTQGNVNFNRLLTVNSNPLNMQRYTGQRVFVGINDEYYQLAVPSAFEISLNGCRWIYKFRGELYQVCCWGAADGPEIMMRLDVLEGSERAWLISHELTTEHQWSIEQTDPSANSTMLRFWPGIDSELNRLYPDGSFTMLLKDAGLIKNMGGDELLFADHKSRGLNFVVTELLPTRTFGMSLRGELVNNGEVETPVELSGSYEKDTHKANLTWKRVSNELRFSECGGDLAAIAESLPWFAQNAGIHYLTPHGLEQYGGAAWGTRDICQGPVEMLLGLGHYEAARAVLARVLSNQEDDGNWPQWWMFDRYSWIRSDESHGDVIFWPILAVSEYVKASGDFDFLDAELPYYCQDQAEAAEYGTVLGHLVQAVIYVTRHRFAKGTMLADYSDGDWNDSMQPANLKLKKRLISCWTVGLNYQAFKELSEICRVAGHKTMAEKLESYCAEIQRDFEQHLIRDKVVAGFGLVNGKNSFDLLLHPSDKTTGISYRLLPMIRGIISGIFTAEQAWKHAELIEKHLKGPDGARLMDCPPKYHGGLQQYFKRAESCPFFGREIGLMYTHAHLRYAEAMAKLGERSKFVRALRQVVPVGLREVVSQANLRQANCYYSSSDGGFDNRYEVNEHYDDLKAGKIELKGGWRIYSSGPGMFVRFVIEYLLGVRQAFGQTVFDPMLTAGYSGLKVDMRLRGQDVQLKYNISGKNVRSIKINGKKVEFEREANPYRTGGAMIDNVRLEAALGA